MNRHCTTCADLAREHPQTDRAYPLGASHVALEGVPMRLLVRPPNSDDYTVIKIKGFFRRRLITEAVAPSKTEINAQLDHYRQLGVIESDLNIP